MDSAWAFIGAVFGWTVLTFGDPERSRRRWRWRSPSRTWCRGRRSGVGEALRPPRPPRRSSRGPWSRPGSRLGAARGREDNRAGVVRPAPPFGGLGPGGRGVLGPWARLPRDLGLGPGVGRPCLSAWGGGPSLGARAGLSWRGPCRGVARGARSARGPAFGSAARGRGPSGCGPPLGPPFGGGPVARGGVGGSWLRVARGPWPVWVPRCWARVHGAATTSRRLLPITGSAYVVDGGHGRAAVQAREELVVRPPGHHRLPPGCETTEFGSASRLLPITGSAYVVDGATGKQLFKHARDLTTGMLLVQEGGRGDVPRLLGAARPLGQVRRPGRRI